MGVVVAKTGGVVVAVDITVSVGVVELNHCER